MITPAITHANVGHMVFNMIGLLVEFLLKLYVAGAIGGSVFYLVHHTFLNLITPTEVQRLSRTKLGASCAVNAIMLLDIFLHPTVPAVLLGIFLIGKDIPRIMEGNIHVSGSRHLGGAAVAAIAWVRLRMGLRTRAAHHGFVTGGIDLDDSVQIGVDLDDWLVLVQHHFTVDHSNDHNAEFKVDNFSVDDDGGSTPKSSSAVAIRRTPRATGPPVASGNSISSHSKAMTDLGGSAGPGDVEEVSE
ncbi:RHOMBOID-like protein 12, mitochondrial [Rosa rugosa]|uniref:RHOMBOID-like protein 12, mitochondrial n=1 Tax=Rosa rugosa TaxID=74645 RepID=UPI002B412947|nr:RHOMBOID-like protein 12, mitochondrial [Rosa rugosa]